MLPLAAVGAVVGRRDRRVGLVLLDALVLFEPLVLVATPLVVAFVPPLWAVPLSLALVPERLLASPVGAIVVRLRVGAGTAA